MHEKPPIYRCFICKKFIKYQNPWKGEIRAGFPKCKKCEEKQKEKTNVKVD